MIENAHEILDIQIEELLFITDDEVDHRYKEKLKQTQDEKSKTDIDNAFRELHEGTKRERYYEKIQKDQS
jgi:hypothetical protein